jgi:esterase/lipase superfamily enzyme
VFIHGYNVSFFEAARRTAQLHWDLGFRGTPAFFSWPSGGSLLDYWADEASSEWAASHLREFLDLLAKRSGAKKIHLIAHSMGNRPLSRALAEIGSRNPTCDPPTKAQFSQVIMPHPTWTRTCFSS